MTDNIVAFINARLDEDELSALAASAPYRYAAQGATVPPGGVHWTWVVGENWTPVTVDPAADDTVGGPDYYGCSVNLASVEEWRTEGSDHGWPVRTMPRTVANQMVEVDSSAAGHIVRHDPARALREVGAKRRTMARHQPVEQWVGHTHLPPEHPGARRLIGVDCSTCRTGTCWDDYDASCGALPWPCPEVRDVAAPYSEHPDFRQEWTA